MTSDTAALLATAEAAMANVSSDAEAHAITQHILAETRRLRSIKMHGGELPPTPLAQAMELDPDYRDRPHIRYLSDRLTDAVHRVEAGENVMMRVSMPPRYGKTTTMENFLVWVLRHHPDWPIAVVSVESTLATKSGRFVRRTIEADPGLGITIAPDAGAVSEWETTKGGGIISRGIHGTLVGRGAKILVLDDLVKDFVAAHSAEQRQALWDWWLGPGQSRLERPYLVVAVGTRWHEDDILGRMGSREYEGDPEDWEDVILPAFAEEGDQLGRQPGEPLISPLVDETPEEATKALEQTRTNVGSYAFSAMFLQRPSPAKGSIFDSEWWRYWTTDPGKVTDDGKVVLLDTHDLTRRGAAGRLIESWDCAFKDTDSSDYVVGQMWCRVGVRRFLLAQSRARMSFSKTKLTMQEWAIDHPTVYERLVEDKANGTAIIDVLTDEVEGMIAINPTTSKTARARAVTPECEAGNVYLPHPSDPGNEWVLELLKEFREFPTGIHDDQVDATTQALMRLRDVAEGSVHVPGTARGNNPLVRQLSARTITRTSSQNPRRTR